METELAGTDRLDVSFAANSSNVVPTDARGGRAFHSEPRAATKPNNPSVLPALYRPSNPPSKEEEGRKEEGERSESQQNMLSSGVISPNTSQRKQFEFEDD